MAETYRDLIAWQKAMQLVVQVYRSTQAFPTEERYGLTAQLRRAAVSIPSNIAEGKGRFSSADTIHFMV
ncbi:MAG: four helix bundle protein, partial [Burkholderiales bacterium]